MAVAAGAVETDITNHMGQETMSHDGLDLMNFMHYPAEKFPGAVSCLIGEGPLAERLAMALEVISYLDHGTDEPPQVPKEIEKDFEELWAKIRGTKHGSEGSIAAYVSGIDEAKMQAVAQQIVDWSCKTERAWDLITSD